MELTESIKYIKGVGEKKAKDFQRLDIFNLNDLLTYYPKQYEDRTKFDDLSTLEEGKYAQIKGKIVSNVISRNIRKNFSIQTCTISLDFGGLECVWYNQPYLRDNLKVGETYIFYGKIKGGFGKFTIQSPEYIKEDLNTNELGFLGVYGLTKNINQKYIRKIINNALPYIEQFDTVIPKNILEKYNLIEKRDAIKLIHQPKTEEEVKKARHTLVFEEFFLLQLALLYIKGETKREKGIAFKNIPLDKIFNNLKFKLTNSQEKVLKEIQADFLSNNITERLLCGDVGSGKTIIAIILSYIAVCSGYQVAVMAPTAILAVQHLESFKEILDNLGIKVALLKSQMRKKERDEIIKSLNTGELDILIGTHAILEESVVFNNLGLVITDEQHRFGVRQRKKIISKGVNVNTIVMSATPIPRTLSLILYGDLDISIIDELPLGRKEIQTAYIDYTMEHKMNMFIENEIKKGRQIYVVCPLVEQNEELPLRSVEEVTKEYITNFPDRRVEYIHGKMKEKEKNEIMEKFKNGDIDILISTTVIEVGINVPNATMMIIENAERFGLAQLHQLRGRIGRGEHQSYCVLKLQTKGKVALERAKIMKQTTNGFEISEKDLEIRGGGDFFGTKQHGLPQYKIANTFTDLDILKEAQTETLNLLKSDPKLEKTENKLLKQHILNMIDTVL